MNSSESWKDLYLKVLSKTELPDKRLRWYFVWVERFEKFLPEKPLAERTLDDVNRFLENRSDRDNIGEWQIRQASKPTMIFALFRNYSGSRWSMCVWKLRDDARAEKVGPTLKSFLDVAPPGVVRCSVFFPVFLFFFDSKEDPMTVDLEKILRPVDTPMPPFEAKYMTIASGEHMVIRQVGREEIPYILPYVAPLVQVERDYYDLVAARVYAELLSYYHHRVQDEYVLVAQIDGELAAIVNGRRVTADVGMSLHTLGLRRGLRIGAHAFASKMEFHIDIMKQQEVLVVAESPIGFRRWMIEYKLEKRFDIPHELGGVPSYALTKELFDRARNSLIVGRRPVPEEILAKAKEAILPPSDPPRPPMDLLAATRSMYDATGTGLMAQQWKQEGRSDDA